MLVLEREGGLRPVDANAQNNMMQSPCWQEYFTESALDLVRRLDVDGFRFDAPTYNEAPNWSPETEKRASASQLGSVEHFARLRPLLKSLKPDAMLYTEPSGTFSAKRWTLPTTTMNTG